MTTKDPVWPTGSMIDLFTFGQNAYKYFTVGQQLTVAYETGTYLHIQ